MTRETKADLQKLLEFIDGYSLSALSNQRGFRTILSKAHSGYLALLTFSAEIDEQASDVETSQADKASLPLPQEKEYLEEAISDIGQALFCWIHGCNKGARILVRSSIETFAKGICCGDEPQILTLKRVHDVFEVCSKTSFLSSSPNDSIFAEMVQKYGELCAYVHTGSRESMASISSIDHFPVFHESDSRETCDVITYVAARMLLILSFRFNEAFHRMHHRNRESIMDCLIPAYRRRIQNLS